MPSADFIEQRSNSDSDDSLTTPKTPAKKGRGQHPNSRANLVAPYPKGVSGNPGGKPRVDVSAIIARAILEGNQEAVYQGLAKALIKGNAYVFKELSDRAYGKVNTPVTVEAGDQLATILTEGRQRAAANRGSTAPAIPAIPAIPIAAAATVLEIVPTSEPVIVAGTQARDIVKPVAVAKPAPTPSVPSVPIKTELSAEEHSQRFFDHIGGNRIHGNTGR
jgi:hypothetical protein